ncbi:helix-turn-helix transcriptional regulator [uncultured Pseudokineococcus sp.]|uniref:helix-turn-helix transcriptional regulator n=1 Tax=uncultured Pseudokineococcus sp. TaxID=1642928 RepID=UPI002605548C|nr:helix-turn-helix transcriptional regulator [uncultured Pseudokineococcus sp.]
MDTAGHGLWEDLDRVRRARDARDAWDVGVRALEERGVTQTFRLTIVAGVRDVRSTAPPWWARRHRRSVQSGEDPFVRHCFGVHRPVLVGPDAVREHRWLTPVERRVVYDAGDALDVRVGVSLPLQPVRAPGGRGCVWKLLSPDRGFARELEQGAGALQLLASAVEARLEEDRHVGVQLLTARERDCLTLVALGHRQADVAARLHLAEVTVEGHVRSARRRLGARTRDQAVAIALVSGQLEV